MKRIAGSILIALFVATTAAAQFTRISAKDFAASPARVVALEKAVRGMKARNTLAKTTKAYRTSWAYWANTHGYFGPSSPMGTASAFKAAAPDANHCGQLSGPALQQCISYYTHVQGFSLPADGGITQKVWAKCQHGNLQFLPWHRMYLKYFERVMRKASGDPNFTLPYWDYYDDVTAGGDILLPKVVRNGAAAWMIDTFRTPGLNASTTPVDKDTGSAEQAFDFNGFTNFSQTLEQQPHGAMHCGTGWDCQAPDIGRVPVAGWDPVFYMHHANIDRLWQCWMVRKANGATINLAWAKANLGMPQSWFDQAWNFVDENGNPVSMKVSQLFEPGGIDYKYDQVTDCVPTPVAAPPVEGVPAVRRQTVTSPEAVSLKGRTLTVPLAVSTIEGPEADVPDEIDVEPGHSVLIIENVRIEGGHPGVSYEIHLSRKSDPAARVFVATISWFGVMDQHEGHDMAERPGHRLLYYDVTSELARLGHPPEDDLAVTFEPARETPRAGTVTVGSIRVQTAQ
jgi:hypothetical protein